MELTFYYRPSCSSCRRLSATLDQIIEERKLTMRTIPADKDVTLGIMYVPTLIISYQGIEIGRFTSALSKSVIDNYLDELQDYINEHL
ncbi:thioredoxin family protein [Brevibacillus laterosporus]|uniref:Thioredoxin family protein n=1 Tax=Brevibacillus laterosporus TaxID=1465 RepID=A0AAP8U422_BRELA|nr:thioredoxin family protein [Brevibacillus laterosporus]MCR8982857.1 thioredoxin family protein [Brevibacillus laterosporus]MCZ0810013.1 thioredoxin family protein [Brevibacillus laterosporus]MCZ0828628.1 thioredoxin family protein [Brevibacillus laterosporus]MCZ0852682.1 thioredoxin family protein [Brevibacillus laterosporus]MED1666947.1 thioredoxin family protein [Brevibacillus laterosporus]